jgi:hypothetical protein
MEVLYTNADSLLNKRDELELLIDSLGEKPHIIAITEVKSKTKSDAKISEFSLRGYNLVANDLEKNVRGILVYVRSDVKFSEITTEIEFEEMIIIKVSSKTHGEIHFGVIYRSPNSTNENTTKLFDLIRKLNEEHTNLLLMETLTFQV